tara:strand:- start:328 stop:717 length:390 start_codon:yes stop_codon:yes gene_type:complete
MFQRRQRRFGRHRSGDRRNQSRTNSNDQSRSRPYLFSNGHSRNKFRPSQNAEKLLEKYKNLAKEALSFGDKTLYENYLQHADHFSRVIDDKNRNQNKNQINDKPIETEKKFADNENSKKEVEVHQKIEK